MSIYYYTVHRMDTRTVFGYVHLICNLFVCFYNMQATHYNEYIYK